jgi:hypothetical protein
MNQLIELQSIRDLSQYIVNQSEGRRKFYLYFYNKSYNCETLDAPPCHIDARTIHIGNPSRIRIKNRDNVFYDDQLALNKLGFNFNKDGDWRFDNPYVKQDIGDSIVIVYHVYYELKPGATRFENKKDIDMRVSPILFEEVSVFDMGDIGYELAEITPEQAAEKYFGHSDFTKFFSKYALASKQMSLTPRERRLLGIERISLTGMHPVNPPSSFHDYVNAWKQLFSGKHQLKNPVVTPSKTASVLAGAAGGLMLKSGRPLSALATMSVPFLAMLHSRIREQQKWNNKQKQTMAALSGNEPNQILTKGAMASELMRRLTTDTTHFGRNESFAHMHRRVHHKPTHQRIHSETNAETNGGKMRRTKKNKMRRTKKIKPIANVI